MALVIGYIRKQICEILEKRDTRIDHLPFTSPSSALLLLTSYVYFVTKLGPSLMSKRKPFALQKAMYALYYYRPNFNFACQPVMWDTSLEAILEAKGVYYFYCLKILDLCDTVFFVLRKKTRQVSFLHVCHHSAVMILTYIGLGWSAGGQFIIVGLFNAVVHTIMYTYYLLSAYKPQLKENVKIKKFVTSIQLARRTK